MERINLERELQKYEKNTPNRWKGRGFVAIPHQVFFDERLSRSSLMVFWALKVHLFKGKKYVFPSFPTIAKEARVSPRTAFSAVKELQKYGYVEIAKKGRNNMYFLKADI